MAEEKLKQEKLEELEMEENLSLKENPADETVCSADFTDGCINEEE